MFFFNNNTRKYRVCVAALLAICGCDQSESSHPPFANSAGYLKEGIAFDDTIYDANGNPFSLKDFKGKVVIVAFSTTWCPNCPNVLQSLDNLEAKNIPNLKIIALNVGDEEINEIKIHYKIHNIQLLDVYRSVNNEIMRGIRGVPACLVFDTDGKFVCGYLGKTNFCSQEFMDFISSLLNKN
ncbi:MAG: TlpA family protein disulfide reductase [Holosporaceae bacterium]|nr:TlpA family protein disulfide reductase [Holosporaceae bacterium]